MPGNARTTAGFYVDHRLPDHRATTHTAEETGDYVGCTLRNTLLRGSAALAGDFAHKVQGQQGFDQTNGGQNDRIGQDDLEGFPVQRHHRDVEGRQPPFDRGQIADARHVQTEADHQCGHDHDTGQSGAGTIRVMRGMTQMTAMVSATRPSMV